MRSKLLLPTLLLLFNPATLGAQQPPSDPLGENLFPPELVMQHQQSLGLSEEQKTFFKTELRQAQALFTELQWRLQDEMEKMVALVKQDRVDESQTIAQLDKILNLEGDIKRRQIALLIKIKNGLTPEQQVKLRELRSKSGGR
ncbi:MAG TPA: periplasmic heavy metal sensor [Candidatus Binatia bacterium]|nr:periplasmic heavy metal sensor [Candidatus Binatia bacterium]